MKKFVLIGLCIILLTSCGLPTKVDKVIRTVVFVKVTSYQPSYWDPNDFRKIERSGSGVIIDKYTILTAAHVVRDANEIIITLYNGSEYAAESWSFDPNNDVGIIKIAGHKSFPFYAELGNSDSLKVGKKVFIIGSPFGYRQFNSVTTGIISGLKRNIPFFGKQDLIQTDAAGNPGNSGGPLFDMQGKVIGIVSGSIRGADGLMFCTTINVCKKFLDDEKRKLLNNGKK